MLITEHFLVENHGTLVGFTPRTQEAKEWFAEHVASEPWQWMGGSLMVEHRMADDLLAGLLTDLGAP